MTGYMTSAKSANGQHSTRRMHQTRNFSMLEDTNADANRSGRGAGQRGSTDQLGTRGRIPYLALGSGRTLALSSSSNSIGSGKMIVEFFSAAI